VEADDLDRVDVLVGGQPRGISMGERGELLERLRILAGDQGVVDKFEAAWATRRVELGEDELARLRVALELWQAMALDDFPDGIAHLLDALKRSAPGGDTASTTADE
jgi:hypothetical protein